MSSALHRPVCDLLGCTHPIVLAGMGGVARAELVSAIARAGGFGFLGMVREPVELIRAEVKALRRDGIHRFGVNLIPAATPPDLLEAQIRTCLELQVPVVGLFWDLSADIIRRLREAGIVVVTQVGSVAEAVSAQEMGAQVIIAQGCEAGGHVRGDTPLSHLLPAVVAATDLPVLAAGGLTDGRDVAAMLALGADGAVLGTAFLATHESFAHPYHKERLVTAAAGDTVLTDVFHINWPRGAKVRVLANSVTRGERGDAFAAQRTVIGDEDGRRPIYLFSTDSPLRSIRGDFEAMALYAGMGVDRISEVTGAGERLRRIAAEASARFCFDIPDDPPQLASPTCYAHEMEETYMGFMSREQLQSELHALLEVGRKVVRSCLQLDREVGAPALRQQTSALQLGAIQACGGLVHALHLLGSTPRRLHAPDSSQGFDLEQRITTLRQEHESVAERLRDLLPKVPGDTLYNLLSHLVRRHAAASAQRDLQQA